MSGLDELETRGANQVAAALVFKRLSRLSTQRVPAQSGDKAPPLWETTSSELWWDALLHRVAKHIILPKARVPGRADADPEDRVRECMTVILEVSRGGFTYEGLGKAIKFFTLHWSGRNRPKLDQPQLVPLPESEVKSDTDDDSARETAEDDESEAEGLRQRKLRASWYPVLPEEAEADRQSWRERNRQQWRGMLERLGRTAAIKCWVLRRLKEHHKLKYDEMVPLVLKGACDILGDSERPPGVTWQEVQQAFQEMANRSPAKRITTDALRKVYSKAMMQLGIRLSEITTAEKRSPVRNKLEIPLEELANGIMAMAPHEQEELWVLLATLEEECDKDALAALKASESDLDSYNLFSGNLVFGKSLDGGRLKLTARAKSDLAALFSGSTGLRLRRQVKSALRYLADNPIAGISLKKRWAGCWRFRGRDYRIVYQLLNGEVIIQYVRFRLNAPRT